MTSWLGGNSLEPKPPQRDFFKFQKLDKFGYNSCVLRFSAKQIKNPTEIEKHNKYVISYYLSDDQIQVNVYPEDGNGKLEKFLSKGRIKKPKKFQSDDPANHSVFYTAQDLYVGAIITFNSHDFLITDADDYVFDFMEKENFREQFIHSNIRVILNKVAILLGTKVKAMMARFMENDSQDRGLVMETVFRNVLNEFTGLNLTEHEIITLVRKFRILIADHPSGPDREKIKSLLQAELKRDNFAQFDKVLLALKQFQIKKNEPLNKNEIRTVFISSLGLSRSQQRIQVT